MRRKIKIGPSSFFPFCVCDVFCSYLGVAGGDREGALDHMELDRLGSIVDFIERFDELGSCDRHRHEASLLAIDGRCFLE